MSFQPNANAVGPTTETYRS